MPSMPLADAVVLFQPVDALDGTIKPGTLRVVHQDDFALRRQFALDWPATYPCRSNNPQAQLTGLMLLFRYLTVELGVPAKDVDDAFMEIEEYSAAMLAD